jgi:transcriptional regulator
MYIPTHYAETRTDVQHALIATHPLATLVHAQAGGIPGEIAANHIPMMVVDSALHAHVARANPLWQEADGQHVLAIFQGPSAYISPGYYPSKKIHGKVVPTWNYAVVHVHGVLRVHDDATWLTTLLNRLTNKQEATFAAPWSVSDAPDDYIERLKQHIVGIEVEITRIEAKWKVSQNYSAADRNGAAEGLDADNNPASAALIRQFTSPRDD